MRYSAEWYATDRRYQAIVDYLAGRRNLHVLDFGCFNSYYAARLAAEYAHHVVAVDNTPLEPAEGVAIVNKHLGPKDIRRLGHFDVGLCLSVLHHQKQPRNYLNTLLAVCDVLFVEAANPAEVLPGVDTHKNSATILADIAKHHPTALCETPGWDSQHMRTLWVIDQRAARLNSATLDPATPV